MRQSGPLDLILTLALAGTAIVVLVRPSVVSRAGAFLVLPKTKSPTFTAPRHVAPRSRSSIVPAVAREIQQLTSCHLPPAHLRKQELTRGTGRRLNGGAAMLSLSVLADSAVEHYRGSFQNRAMYAPLLVSALTLGASLFGMADIRAERHVARDAVYAAAAATGFAGLGFHAYNILKRPGGWSWLNLFYSAPIGAPMALALAGLLGRGAERVRDTPLHSRASVLGLPAGRLLAAVTAMGLAGTVGEAGLLHFRGAYHDPAMLLPVTVPPVASLLLGASALRPDRAPHRATRWWLRLTALLGFAGVGFHAFGVSRNMGGWRNWSQNVLNGPPLPAPPSFTGLALAGLAALTLIERAETHD